MAETPWDLLSTLMTFHRQPLEDVQILKLEQQVIIDFQKGLKAGVSAVHVHEFKDVHTISSIREHRSCYSVIHCDQHIFQVHFRLVLQMLSYGASLTIGDQFAVRTLVVRLEVHQELVQMSVMWQEFGSQERIQDQWDIFPQNLDVWKPEKWHLMSILKSLFGELRNPFRKWYHFFNEIGRIDCLYQPFDERSWQRERW